MLMSDTAFDMILSKSIAAAPKILCLVCAKELRIPEFKTRVCVECAAEAIAQKRAAREAKKKDTLDRRLAKQAAIRQKRDAARAGIKARHGEWASRSDYYLHKQIAGKRKKLLRLLRAWMWNTAIEENRKRKADLAEEVEFTKSVDAAWYASNPPRTCTSCGEEKRLYDFKKDRKSGRYQGHVCRTCLNRKKKAAERKRNPPKPRKVYTDEQRREAERKQRRQYAASGKKRESKIRQRSTSMGRINRNLSEVIRRHFREFKAGKPLGGWKAVVGYSLQDLKEHLEAQFKPGMSWNNYGEWSIDHIRPKASYFFLSADDPQFKELWALDNLQPLWALENSYKGTSW